MEAEVHEEPQGHFWTTHGSYCLLLAAGEHQPPSHHMSWLGARVATSTVSGRELLLQPRCKPGGLQLLGPAS
jgi:hypothetical protein